MTYPTCDCPYCKEPTKQQIITSVRTAIHYPPIIDEDGNNINPDGNITTEARRCIKCNREFSIKIQYGEVIEIENVDREGDDPWWIKYQKNSQ